jgi:hypothetical protein
MTAIALADMWCGRGVGVVVYLTGSGRVKKKPTTAYENDVGAECNECITFLTF